MTYVTIRQLGIQLPALASLTHSQTRQQMFSRWFDGGIFKISDKVIRLQDKPRHQRQSMFATYLTGVRISSEVFIKQPITAQIKRLRKSALNAFYLY